MKKEKLQNDSATDLQNDNATGQNHSGDQANKPLKLLTVTSIIGDRIFNPDGDDLGSVVDIMIDIVEAKIEYVVIEFGGFLGIHKKYFAVPFQALSIDIERQAFIVNETRESMEKFPGFDKSHWPETNVHENSKFFNYGGFMGSNTGSEY